MVDESLIRRKLADLDEFLGQLAEYRQITVEAYRSDWKTQRIVERTLHLAIETCVDVGEHVIADRRLRVPGTYAEVFEVLAEAGLIDASLREPMVRMAGFRNIIVHEYARIDAGIVVGVVRDRLADFARFRDTVLTWL